MANCKDTKVEWLFPSQLMGDGFQLMGCSQVHLSLRGHECFCISSFIGYPCVLEERLRWSFLIRFDVWFVLCFIGFYGVQMLFLVRADELNGNF